MEHSNILIVDDDILSIQFIVSSFEQQNSPYNFIMAQNGPMALELVNKTMPDLIIVDWEMPEMTGIEVIKDVKSLPALQHIPIIMLTGKMTSIQNLKEALNAGAIDFMEKPFNNIELYSRVHAALQFAKVLKEKNKNEWELLEAEKKILELRTNKLELTVSQQKKELISSAMQIQQAAKLQTVNLNLINKLYTHVDKKGHPILREIITNYTILQKQTNWKVIEQKFDEAFKDFDQNLLEKHPKLTPSERRLCAFLRLNMTSKDIAVITFQKESSINQARYRLRKKLKISSDENLITFLSKI